MVTDERRCIRRIRRCGCIEMLISVKKCSLLLLDGCKRELNKNNTAAKHVNDGIDNDSGFGVFASDTIQKGIESSRN